MNIKKRKLADLEYVYVVNSICLDGRTCFLAASEGRDGPCLLFQPPDWKPSAVWAGPGGSMSVVPVPGRKNAFMAIQGFFPTFQSEDAGIVYAEPSGSIVDLWNVRRVIDLPFVHRFEIVEVETTPFVIAASLCKAKDSQDDWSKPGAVYVCPIPRIPDGDWPLKFILEGVSKNHGMHVADMNHEKCVLVSGQEGLFAIKPPASPDGIWEHEQLLSHEVSDAYVADIDNDGMDEIATIEPFHGDALAIYKFIDDRLQKVYETGISFGHVVWAGTILGKSAVIGGSRDGEKDLFLLQPKSPGSLDMEKTIIDKDIGPTQILAVHEYSRDLILSANHGAGEVVLYEIT